jgi:short-subunit dehydrogenase
VGSYVLITGALGGLGQELARECALRGFNLFLTDRSQDASQFLSSIEEDFSIQVHYHPCELTSEESRTELFDTIKRGNLKFRGLINVAGQDFEGPFLDQSRDQLLYLINLLIEAMVDLSHTILNLRDPEQRFMLINISSLAGFFPMPYKATYSAAKGFIKGFSRALREEIKSFGNVLVVTPAGLPTTDESRRKIHAQGIWGKMTAMDTKIVARRTIDLALQERAVYVPGLLNRLLARMGMILPDTIVTDFIGKRWRAVQHVVEPHQKLK